jgi:murein DD-endopeptidase MepM/ murein hydrolase activator NlpD
MRSAGTPLSKLRFLAASLLILAALLTIPVLLSTLWINPTVHAASTDSTLTDSPNVMTSGMFSAADKLGKASGSMNIAISNSLHSVSESVVTAAAASSKVVAKGAVNGANLVADGTSNSFNFAVNTAGGAVGLVGKAPVISSIIKPADNMQVPEINSDTTAVAAANAAPSSQPPSNPAPAQQPADTETSWPIRGAITTEFGVPHMPYQPYHTGIDISDGKYAGITPIHPFKPGKVIEVVHSKVSFGNYVLVDHGNGVTSLYGHMYSTNVQVGQQVDKNSVLGLEGTSGASTGVHVHFEIRLNGQPVNPHKYVTGQP